MRRLAFIFLLLVLFLVKENFGLDDQHPPYEDLGQDKREANEEDRLPIDAQSEHMDKRAIDRSDEGLAQRKFGQQGIRDASAEGEDLIVGRDKRDTEHDKVLLIHGEAPKKGVYDASGVDEDLVVGRQERDTIHRGLSGVNEYVGGAGLRASRHRRDPGILKGAAIGALAGGAIGALHKHG